MSSPLIATKLYVPPAKNNTVLRSRLNEQLNEGLSRKLILISAPAGFGKTTLISEWIHQQNRLGITAEPPNDTLHPSQVAWLSLEQADSDLTRFLTYFVAAVQMLVATNPGENIMNFGATIQTALLAQPPPATELLLTNLLNEINALPDHFVLVLDDYHAIDSKPVDAALTFLLDHLPPQMHLVITTREDPRLPLSRLRARGELTELRAADLRFTPAEAAEFLNAGMGLALSAQDIAALEARTEGWIAGLQLASLALKGHLSTSGQADASHFIKSFTGSHHFVLDYLMQEVLRQQPENIQTFLLRSSILERMCGPLCDAVLRDPGAPGQATLESLERANLFVVPLDNERRWYRYHHLFADLLRQRLQSAALTHDAGHPNVAELHQRASEWYEANGLELEAFHHAVAANDVVRAERLVEGAGVPLHFRGPGAPVLHWLESLPVPVLNARPSLWVTYASALMMTGQISAVEQKLVSAEAALQAVAPDDSQRDIIGRIASMRATMGVMQHNADLIIAQSLRALEYLAPNNLPLRTAANWTLGYAHQVRGERAAARRAYDQVISISQSFGNSIYTTAATLCLAQVYETENLLHWAVETYRRAIVLAGDPPRSIACEAYLGLARIYYQWNDLDTADQHGQQSLQLMQQIESIDTPASHAVFLARLKLARGDVSGAAAVLDKAKAFVLRNNFPFRLPDIVAVQVLVLLQQNNLAAAAQLLQTHDLPLSRVRLHLAQGDTSAALAELETLRQQAEPRAWADEQLKLTILHALTLHAHGDQEYALRVLGGALKLAEPGGFVRLFLDEGQPMSQLLSKASAQGIMSDYTAKLLAASQSHKPTAESPLHLAVRSQPLVEPLSQRELQVLDLMVRGLSNRQISERLFLALDTVKGHNRRIFAKLQVSNRAEAITRARELNLLQP